MNALVQNYEDEIQQVLAYHGGDVHAAIEPPKKAGPHL